MIDLSPWGKHWMIHAMQRQAPTHSANRVRIQAPVYTGASQKQRHALKKIRLQLIGAQLADARKEDNR